MSDTPLDASLVRAYEVCKVFPAVPRTVAPQRALVSMYYPDGVHEVPVGKLPPKQLFRIAERLFWRAHKMLRTLSRQEQAAVKTLWELAGSMRALARPQWEDLDERICIQLEGIPDDSPVIAEYRALKEQKRGKGRH
jgi:hypothetical protein